MHSKLMSSNVMNNHLTPQASDTIVSILTYMFPHSWYHTYSIVLYLGLSPNHAGAVPLLLNISTGKIVTNYHVVCDNYFTTVSSSSPNPINFDQMTIGRFPSKHALPVPSIGTPKLSTTWPKPSRRTKPRLIPAKNQTLPPHPQSAKRQRLNTTLAAISRTTKRIPRTNPMKTKSIIKTLISLLLPIKVSNREGESTGFIEHELHFDPKLVRMSYALKAHVIQRHE